MRPAPRIVVRADGGARLGWGHLKRCLALATALQARGAELSFVTRGAEPGVAALLQAAGIRHQVLTGPLDDPAQDAAETLAALRTATPAVPPDIVIVDHYRLDARWHDAMRAATGARIVVIDDLADRPLAADLLVDQNPCDDHAGKYRKVLADGVPLCGGPGFALLAPAYASHAGAVLHDPLQTIGLFLGASDPAGHTLWALHVLRQRAGWQGAVRLASSSANPALAVLHAAVQADERLSLQVDAPDLADFFAGLDLALIAGGGALWECCSLGVPTLALVCADNQRQSVPWVAAAGAVQGLDAIGQTAAQAAALGAALRVLIADATARQRLAGRARRLVDGQGAARVADRVLALLADLPSAAEASPPLQLRPATLADAERLYVWRNDAGTRAASHHDAPVAWPDHLAWLSATLTNPARALWVAWRGDEAVGTLRADTPPGAAQTTLSWTVAPDQRGSGLGRALVQLAAHHWSGALHAEVKVGNTASVRAAEAAGFRLDAEVAGTLHFSRPALTPVNTAR